MGICLSNPIKDESHSHSGAISYGIDSVKGSQGSIPSSKPSSASIGQIPPSEGAISYGIDSVKGSQGSIPSSKPSSASISQIPLSEGVISSKIVSGHGTEVSNPSSKASSASIPQIPRSVEPAHEDDVDSDNPHKYMLSLLYKQLHPSDSVSNQGR